MGVVAGGGRIFGNACGYRCANTEADRNGEFGDCLEYGAGDGLLRVGQRAKDIHLRRSESATLQEVFREIRYSRWQR